MLHNVTKMTEIALNFHKSKKIFFSKEFYVDKEIGRAYTSFLRRDVAQSGSALEWGSRGRRFKSFHPDQKAEPQGIYGNVDPFSVFSGRRAGCLFLQQVGPL